MSAHIEASGRESESKRMDSHFVISHWRDSLASVRLHSTKETSQRIAIDSPRGASFVMREAQR